MKKLILFGLVFGFGISLITGCGESTKQRQEREAATAKHRADSITLVEKEKAKLEQQRADSMANVEKRKLRLAADSAVRAELLPLFIEEKNVPTEGMVTYKLKSAPKGHGFNSANASFYADNGVAKEMKVTFDYAGSGWIFIESGTLEVDGETFTYFITDDKGDKVSDIDSEWFTTTIGSGLINQLCEAKSVKVILNGKEQSKSTTLTESQVKGMSDVAKLYKAMGGN